MRPNRTGSATSAHARFAARALVAALIAALALPSAPARGDEPDTPPAPARGGAPDPTWPGNAVPGTLLVSAAPGVSAATLAGAIGGDPLSTGTVLLRVPPGTEAAAAAALRGHPEVGTVEPDRLRRTAAVASASEPPDDPRYGEQWPHELARIERAWERTVGSRAVRVAVIDSGILGSHPDLVPNIVEQASVASGVVEGRGTGIDNDTCGHGHGTAVAGVLGAVGDNAQGIAGVAWEVALIDLALNASGEGLECDTIPDSAVLAALDYATHHPDGPVDVVNLSIGSPQSYCPEPYDLALRAAADAGISVVAAAGNTRAGLVHIPGSCPNVISVGAVRRDGIRADYSAANRWVDLVAPGGADEPGERLLTTSRDGAYASVQGTSFAAAYVSGVIALLRSLRPELTPADLESVLERTAERTPSTAQHTDEYGWGLVRADLATNFVQRRTEIEPPEPNPFFPVLRHQSAPLHADLVRIAPPPEPGTPTSADEQSLAMSRALFRERGAVYAVVARQDDYPDALAGSAITLGLGPLLFAGRDGDLPAPARRELRRVLPAGGKVYLLGGEASLSRDVELHLRRMGYEVVRLAGRSREETAVAVAREVLRQRADLGLAPPRNVMLASRSDWPDAVSAGPLAARFGVPILLTAVHRLHPATAALLREMRPETVLVVGGTGRISSRVARAAGNVSGGATVERLAGANRAETAVAVGERLIAMSGSQAPVFAVAVNLRREDAFAHALTASAFVGAFSGVFVPVEGEEGDKLPTAAHALLEGRGFVPVVIGGEDLVAESLAAELRERAAAQD